MATDHTWNSLQYFEKDSPIDNWGPDVDSISDEILLVADDFRRELGVPLYVLQATGGGHSRDSYHYVENGACAIDVAIPDCRLGTIDLLLLVFRYPFRGVGYYPHWQYGGKKVHGLHLDTRPLKAESDGTLNYRFNRWMGVRREHEMVGGGMIAKQEYLPLTFENLKKYSGELWTP